MIEKAAFVQVDERMQAQVLMTCFSLSTKNKHNTETALLKLDNDIELAVDDNNAKKS